jgi:hypothetical protein
MPHHNTALLCVYYPQQLLPGLSAVVQCRLHWAEPIHEPATILVWSDPGVGDELLAQRKSAFELLLREFPWVNLVFPSGSDIQANLSANLTVARKTAHLRQRFGHDAFSSIFYAHDMGSDYIAQSAMQAFPQAKRVCFGDALGVVYSNDYYTQLTYPLGSLAQWIAKPGRNLINLLWRAKRAYTLPARNNRLDAHIAALILPSDPGGDFLPGKTLLEIDRATLDEVSDSLARGVESDAARCDPAPSSADKHLMLLGSFSESGFTTLAQEKAMYLDVVQEHVPAGTTLLLKAHPASHGEKVRAIARTLATHCKVEISPTESLPIEALKRLASARSVISFSYSSVSLQYLYGSQVVHAMTTARIQRFFPTYIQPWMQDSNDLYLRELATATQKRQRQMQSQTTASGKAPSPFSTRQPNLPDEAVLPEARN